MHNKSKWHEMEFLPIFPNLPLTFIYRGVGE